jgi:predicted lipoprotein with Yx(FWY)xxD motif
MPTTNRRTAGLALGALALTAGLVLPLASGASPVKTSAVVSSARSAFGRVLVDRNGRTLYLFEKDRMAKSSCAGPCATYWPPLLTTGKAAAGTGVRAGLLGTTRRADGTLQVTYNRHPLYRFKLDAGAGQAKGQNLDSFGADWYVLSPAGVKIDKSGAAKNSKAAGAGNKSTWRGYGYALAP